MKQNIGFIGLGSLGTPIAMNLMDSGHVLHVYNRTISKTESLAGRGAIVCKSITDLAQKCSIVFTIVSDDAAIEAVCEGADGLLKNLAKGSIHVSMSTILPATAKKLALLHQQHHQHYLASPVFGRPDAAAAKKLNYVISGEENIRRQIEPLLHNGGAMNIFDFGDDITAANTVKLCGNFLIASALEAIGESANLAVKSGVDAKQMWNVFSQTLFNTPLYHNYSKIILNKQFEPAAFTMKLGLKDMNLVLEQAAEAKHSMPLAQLLQKNMKTIVDSGKENMDWSAVSTAEIN